MNKVLFTLSTALFFFLYSFDTTAQIKIEGVVRDATTGDPIPFVIVSVENSQAGDVTSERGEFEVLVNALPATIIFRMIGYEKTVISVTRDRKLDIKMVESTIELNTVEIRASQLEKIAGNDKRSIWDYAWCEDKLLICDYGTSLKGAQLILLDDAMDTVAMTKAPGKPIDLFNDCMGNAHFQGEDSTWQILLLEDKLAFYPPESNYQIDYILRQCKSADKKRLFFEIPQGSELFSESNPESFAFRSNNDEIVYYYGLRDGSKPVFLTRIQDEVAKKLKEAEVTRDLVMHSNKHGGSYSSNLASKHFFYTTMLREVYAPILTVNESTFIMDYVNGRWVSFDSTMSVLTVDTIGFEYDPRVPFRCITDQAHEAMYIIDERNSIYTIHEVDVLNCVLLKNWSLPHTFPENITIRNGYVYYTHRDPKNHLNRFLSRLKLE